MKQEKESSPWRSNWNLLIVLYVIGAVVIITALIAWTTRVFETPEDGQIPPIVWLMIDMILLFGIIFVLAKTLKALSEIQDINIKLETIADLLHRNNELLNKMRQNLQPDQQSEEVSTSESQAVQPVAVAEIRQDDSAADETSGEEAAEPIAEQEELSAADNEQIAKVTAEIEALFQEYRWAEASKEIESLISAFPGSKVARALQQQLAERKQTRKKVLLASWEAAVKRGATDRSLEILKELDPYLLPNEGLALQEAAKDVYKNKLHNLGVQFSLAVSGSHWRKAFDVGQEIINHYPNSRMAEEIRDKIDVLEQKAGTQAG